MNRSTKKQNKTNLPARRITKKNENKLKDRHVPSLPGWNRKSLLFSLIFLLAPSLFFQSFLFSFFNLPSNGSKKIYYSWMCFQLLLFPRFVWLGSEREREREKKEECMWETFGFCCVRLLLSTCTLVVVVARPFGDLFFLPFFIEGHDIPRQWYTQRSQARHSERMREGVSLLQLKR